MELIHYIALIAAGLAGGHACATTFPDKSLGVWKNSAVAIAGGAAGAIALAAILGLGSGLGGLVQTVAGSGLGGAAVMFVVGSFIRRSGGGGEPH